MDGSSDGDSDSGHGPAAAASAAAAAAAAAALKSAGKKGKQQLQQQMLIQQQQEQQALLQQQLQMQQQQLHQLQYQLQLHQQHAAASAARVQSIGGGGSGRFSDDPSAGSFVYGLDVAQPLRAMPAQSVRSVGAFLPASRRSLVRMARPSFARWKTTTVRTSHLLSCGLPRMCVSQRRQMDQLSSDWGSVDAGTAYHHAIHQQQPQYAVAAAAPQQPAFHQRSSEPPGARYQMNPYAASGGIPVAGPASGLGGYSGGVGAGIGGFQQERLSAAGGQLYASQRGGGGSAGLLPLQQGQRRTSPDGPFALEGGWQGSATVASSRPLSRGGSLGSNTSGGGGTGLYLSGGELVPLTPAAASSRLSRQSSADQHLTQPSGSSSGSTGLTAGLMAAFTHLGHEQDGDLAGGAASSGGAGAIGSSRRFAGGGAGDGPSALGAGWMSAGGSVGGTWEGPAVHGGGAGQLRPGSGVSERPPHYDVWGSSAALSSASAMAAQVVGAALGEDDWNEGGDTDTPLAGKPSANGRASAAAGGAAAGAEGGSNFPGLFSSSVFGGGQ